MSEQPVYRPDQDVIPAVQLEQITDEEMRNLALSPHESQPSPVTEEPSKPEMHPPEIDTVFMPAVTPDMITQYQKDKQAPSPDGQ